MKTRIAVVLAAITLGGNAHAQQQPYAGQHERQVKALSADEVKQYLAGAGMGYAKSAELNHYPGPVHALELADQLRLAPEQRAEAKRLMDAHNAEARAIGAKLVESERALETLFRTGTLAPTALAEAVRNAAALQGEYRLSHLETHRQLRTVLTDEQVARYDLLRGYAAGGEQSTHEAHHKPGVIVAQASSVLSDGEIRKVDKDAKKITIKHGPLQSLDMPPMTMVFQVGDPAMLDQVKAGDKVKFQAEKVGGAYTVVRIEISK